MAESTNQAVRGKTVLITGANGGIGMALVHQFLSAGAATVIAATRESAVTGERIVPARLDITSAASVKALATKFGGAVDILVNNAGVNGNTGILEPAAEEVARAEMEVNYFGMLRMLQEFLPPMRQRGDGVVINMLTILSHVNLPLMASYCASKAAALSLTQAVRAELSNSGIRVMAILPSSVDTRMTRSLKTSKLSPSVVASHTIQAILKGTEDSYPGNVATEFYEALKRDPKELEKKYASYLKRP